MCLIIDDDVVGRVFSGAEDPDFADLFGCLFGVKRPTVQIVYGGRLREEYLRNSKVARLLVLLDRAGRARVIADADISEEEAVVIASGECISNDYHIIAIARVSGVRALCSHDQALHQDFTNKSLLDHPRGRVYQNNGHRHVLVQACA
jgi:hypothetical protein